MVNFDIEELRGCKKRISEKKLEKIWDEYGRDLWEDHIADALANGRLRRDPSDHRKYYARHDAFEVPFLCVKFCTIHPTTIYKIGDRVRP